MIRKYFLTVVSFCIFSIVNQLQIIAQESDIEMADVMRDNGKIFVVVAVVGVILSCLLVFLMIIDKKVRKLEKNDKKN
jgi:hypothetical protein